MKFQTAILRFIALEGSKYVSKRDFEMFGQETSQKIVEILLLSTLYIRKSVCFSLHVVDIKSVFPQRSDIAFFVFWVAQRTCAQ